MKKIMRYFVLLNLFLFTSFSCQKMDDSYKKFVVEGGLTYPQKAINPIVRPGRNRVIVSWKNGTDPTVTKAIVYWNNYTDSVIVDISQDQDSINALIDQLPEQSYTFEIVTLNHKGDKSVPSEALGATYGDNYQSSLLNRPINQFVNKGGDTIQLDWGAADITDGAYMSDILYVNTFNDIVSRRVPISFDSSIISDIKKGTILQYRTIYLPDSLAIDTFYTNYQNLTITTPPIEYDRTGWTALAVDYDVASARVPQNVLDNNITTVWHMDKTHSYPHQITIDMKMENQINGFTFIQRTPLDGAAKLIEIQISDDNQNWQSLGNFTLANTGDKQFVDLTNYVNARYFRVNVESDYKGGTFTAIAEINAYKR